MLLLATLVGCNYAGTRSELRGCINDVRAIRNILITRFGFAAQNITMLTDDNYDPAVRPTGANIKRALDNMAHRARGVERSGAHLFFHFSGHGTLLSGGPYDRHEAIVPCDHNLITDVDFRRLVDGLPEFVMFTMVSDSCHSGGLIAQEKEQIGPTASIRGGAGAGAGRPRFIPCATVMQQLGAPHDLRQLGSHMVRRFGADASALFLYPRAPVPRPDFGILLSGCQWNETSADGEDYGAFTSALLSSLSEHPAAVTNFYMVKRAREVLPQRGYTQHPCLYCNDAIVHAPFLSPWRLWRR